MIDLTAYITVNTANNQMDRTTRPTYVGPISLIHTQSTDGAKRPVRGRNVKGAKRP